MTPVSKAAESIPGSIFDAKLVIAAQIVKSCHVDKPNILEF